MKILVLMTSTNNVPPLVDPLEGLGHRLHRIVYDEMTHADHESLPSIADRFEPDWVLHVGAIVGHHGKPVPSVDVLARIGAKFKTVHLCCDGAETHWWRQLQEYYDRGRFALQVNIDGVRTGPIGDRGMTTICPIDASKYRNPPWEERPIMCGFSGGLHTDRSDFVYTLMQLGVLSYRPRDDDGYDMYRRFLECCRVGINFSLTGGRIGGTHVKARVAGELPAAGCLVLETKKSPLSDWFVPGKDYLEFASVDEAVSQINWARRHQEEAHDMAMRMRAKVIERHSPAVFWSQVMERLGLGRAILPVREIARRHWAPDDPPPVLLENRNARNIVAYSGRIWVIPQNLGKVDIANPSHRVRPGISSHKTVEEARANIDTTPVAMSPSSRVVDLDRAPPPSAPPGPPQLLDSKRGVNLVAYAGKIWAVPQRLGPLDLSNQAHRHLPGVAAHASLEAAHRSLQ